MCQKALDGFAMEVLDEFQIHYVCNCSKERFAKGLLTLGPQEIRSLPLDNQGRVETVCQYCSRKYYFTKEELESLAEQAASSLKKEK